MSQKPNKGTAQSWLHRRRDRVEDPRELLSQVEERGKTSLFTAGRQSRSQRRIGALPNPSRACHHRLQMLVQRGGQLIFRHDAGQSFDQFAVFEQHQSWDGADAML